MMGPLATVGAATLLVVGLILVLSHLVRGRSVGARGMGRDGIDVRVAKRIGIAPRQGVAILEVDGNRILVSCGEGGVRLLKELGRAEATFTDTEDTYGSDRELDEVIETELRGFQGLFGNLRSGRRVGTGRRGNSWNRERERGAAPANADTTGFRHWLRRFAFAIGFLAISVAGAPVLGIGTLAAEAPVAIAQEGATGLPEMDFRLGSDDGDGGLRVTGPVGAVLLIGFMTLIPTLLLLMTSFTRILIVLHLLKQALGAQTAPPAHVLTALALMLTGFVMAPTLAEAHRDAIAPWMDGEMDEVAMLQTAAGPFREFMLTTTRDEDLAFFLDLRDEEPPEELSEIPLIVMTSAFVTSELRAAFQMGFALFLPFVVIDLVVASVLMSMGMFMLPPLMVSLPFKLLLFVLVDGWGLVVGSLVRSFH